MKKALAMLLTLAMLFSCLVVGVAEEAKYVPPKSTADIKDEWIVWEDTWPEGEVLIETEVDGVRATYIDGVLDNYRYTVETENGEVTAEFSADHRLSSLHYWDSEAGKSYSSSNGGKKWTAYDHETGTESVVKLPEGVVIPETPALGEYVYNKPVVADKLEDVDLENGKVTEDEWGGTDYENSTVWAFYNENGLLESYSYWNEDHTIQIFCNYKHQVASYTYADGWDYYQSTDGENWTIWVWDEETGESYEKAVELPDYAEFEKLPALGEYVYNVATPADKLDLENLNGGRLSTWTDEEGNVTSYTYEVGDVWASYDENGMLLYYSYNSEDGNQNISYTWNHEVNQIGVKTEEGWMYSEDGGETWGQWIWDEELGESFFTEMELPEGTEVADMPALGTPVEFERLPVQNIEDLETRLGWAWEEEDEEGNVTTEFYSDELAMHMTFDAEGKLLSYSHWTENWEQYATYSADNKLLYAEYWTEEGKLLSYVASEDAWYESVFDENGDYVEDVKLEEAPEDAEILPALTAKPDDVWYPNNTMGVLGLSLRDTFPGLTKKWYNVVPVDISKDGTTTIPMVASNLYFISNAYVTVDGDNVTVTYDGLSEHGYGWIDDECVAWFTSVDQITTDWLNNPKSDLAFGQTISRANDLDNAEIALLFICNHVTYRQPFYTNDAFLPRYWPNLAQWKAYRADLGALLNQMTVVASPDAEIIDSPSAEIVASPDAGAVAE